MSVGDPDLERRLNVARTEALFERHLNKVFGEGHAKFTPQLREHLRQLWRLALDSEPPVEREMTVREEDELIKRIEFAKLQGIPVSRAHERTQAYPSTVGTWQPEAGPAIGRDTSKPPCPTCGGRGLGDYPYACNRCGGSGNG